mmetsp:Transcript_28057/g.60909  ORF Transcript_28057/g.60909 Transcript_28057/m.60909 type:complete len:291 (+) Transcript_28057:1126-1998(+)
MCFCTIGAVRTLGQGEERAQGTELRFALLPMARRRNTFPCLAKLMVEMGFVAGQNVRTGVSEFARVRFPSSKFLGNRLGLHGSRRGRRGRWSRLRSCGRGAGGCGGVRECGGACPVNMCEAARIPSFTKALQPIPARLLPSLGHAGDRLGRKGCCRGSRLFRLSVGVAGFCIDILKTVRKWTGVSPHALVVFPIPAEFVTYLSSIIVFRLTVSSRWVRFAFFGANRVTTMSERALITFPASTVAGLPMFANYMSHPAGLVLLIAPIVEAFWGNWFSITDSAPDHLLAVSI